MNRRERRADAAQAGKGSMSMGEAKRKERQRQRAVQAWAKARGQRLPRPWAKGQLIVLANGVECFVWSGTQADAIALQKRYLDKINAADASAKEYAEHVIYSLIAHGGPPQIGQEDFSGTVTSADIELIRDAVLWRALREHVPDTGLKIEDALANLTLEVQYSGDRDLILRSRQGKPLPLWYELQVMPRDPYRLDPGEAVSISDRDLFAIAYPGKQHVPGSGPPFLVPRIPLNGDEARAMFQMTAICNLTPEDTFQVYLGYTSAELARAGIVVAACGASVPADEAGALQ